MQTHSSRIDPRDTIVLYVDLQHGIVELSRTISLDRLKKDVLGLSRLAKIFGMPTIVSGVSGQDGAAPKMIPQIAEGLGEYIVHQRVTAIRFATRQSPPPLRPLIGERSSFRESPCSDGRRRGPSGLCGRGCLWRHGRTNRAGRNAADNQKTGGTLLSVMTLAGELAGDFRTPEAQAALGVLYEMATA